MKHTGTYRETQTYRETYRETHTAATRAPHGTVPVPGTLPSLPPVKCTSDCMARRILLNGSIPVDQRLCTYHMPRCRFGPSFFSFSFISATNKQLGHQSSSKLPVTGLACAYRYQYLQSILQIQNWSCCLRGSEPEAVTVVATGIFTCHLSTLDPTPTSLSLCRAMTPRPRPSS